MRILSLLPGATESLFALGLGDSLVGVSHECDHPPPALRLPRVTRPRLALDGLDGAAIDAAVSAAAGEPLHDVDQTRVQELRPDLVVAQAACPVCAVHADQLGGLLAALPGARLVRQHAHDFEAVLGDIEALAAACAVDPRPLLSGLRARVERVASAVAPRRRRRLVFLEWLEPPYVAGHWTPDLVDLAGGSDTLARPGRAARRATWAEVAAAQPELLVVAPCGFDQRRAEREAERLRPQTAKLGVETVIVLDGSAYFNRPGPRLVDGLERLAAALHGYNPPSA